MQVNQQFKLLLFHLLLLFNIRDRKKVDGLLKLNDQTSSAKVTRTHDMILSLVYKTADNRRILQQLQLALEL